MILMIKNRLDKGRIIIEVRGIWQQLEIIHYIINLLVTDSIFHMWHWMIVEIIAIITNIIVQILIAQNECVIFFVY